MYLPEHFKVSDEEKIFSFLKAHSFGQIISTVDGRLFSSHLPFLVNREANLLLAHLAKHNPQYVDIEDQEVLVTFQGPHDYISPAWFSTPGVPTWNYQAVHIYGQCRVIHEPERLAGIVDRLTNIHESSFDQPWQPTYQAAMLAAIVGIEISITEIQCKYKLSQNRTKQDQSRIKQALSARGSDTLADLMDTD